MFMLTKIRKLLTRLPFVLVGFLLALPVTYIVAQSVSEQIPSGVYQSEDGYGIGLSLLWTPTSQPSTNTPTATSSPTATPTNTLLPTATSTATPLPSSTPLPTSTYVFETPTPELTAPPPTFTVTPTQSKNTCTLTQGHPNGYPINIRNGHTTSATIVGKWEANNEATFDEFYEDGTYLWGHQAAGWSAIAESNPLVWWVKDTNNTVFCFDVDGWPGWVPPSDGSNMMLSWFSMPNGNTMEQQQFVYNAATYNIVGGTHVYADVGICLAILNAGGACSYRPGQIGDCPANIFATDARQSARDFVSQLGGIAQLLNQPQYAGRVWVDLINECNWGDYEDQYFWWAQWFDEAITWAEAHGVKLMLPSLGPGYGNELMFFVWKGVLNRLYDVGGMFAMHTYNPVDTWLCPFNEWLADRHVHNYAIMQSLGIRANIALTEVGQGWGNTSPNVDDMACWINRTAQLPYIGFVAIWYNGYNGTWPKSSWTGYSQQLLDKIDKTLWSAG